MKLTITKGKGDDFEFYINDIDDLNRKLQILQLEPTPTKHQLDMKSNLVGALQEDAAYKGKSADEITNQIKMEIQKFKDFSKIFDQVKEIQLDLSISA